MQLNQRLRPVIRALAPVLAAVALMNIPSAGMAVPTSPDVVASIRRNLESRFPGSHVVDVQPTVIPGLFEVYLGDQIVYSDATGDHLIVGNLVDTQTKQNITEAH